MLAACKAFNCDPWLGIYIECEYWAELYLLSLEHYKSESDKRALALSVFIAKCESLSREEQSRSILVFDDPVTSFDDERINRTIRIIEDLRPLFRQVIILTHYSSFLRMYYEYASLNERGIQLLRIDKTSNGSEISKSSKLEFVESLHQKKFRRIKEYIDRLHSDNICQDLRIYLQNEVISRYLKQISDNSLSDLGFKELIDRLAEIGVINISIRDKLEDFRKNLNPHHHIWPDIKQDDIIMLASDVLEFIYNDL